MGYSYVIYNSGRKQWGRGVSVLSAQVSEHPAVRATSSNATLYVEWLQIVSKPGGVREYVQ